VRLICGSDAGTRGAVFTDFVTSLQAFAHVGFTTARILEIATVAADQALALPVGSLAPGYSADILGLDADPLTDLGALRHPRLILARGRRHPGTPASTPAGSP